MKEKSNKFYCYNIEQAQFFIKQGCKLIDTGIHKKTKKTFYVFAYRDFKKYFPIWCNRKLTN